VQNTENLSVKLHYFNLPSNIIRFVNDFPDQVQIALVTDINGAPLIRYYGAKEIDNMKKSIAACHLVRPRAVQTANSSAACSNPFRESGLNQTALPSLACLRPAGRKAKRDHIRKYAIPLNFRQLFLDSIF